MDVRYLTALLPLPAVNATGDDGGCGNKFLWTITADWAKNKVVELEEPEPMSNFCSGRNVAPIQATLYMDSSYNIDDVLSDLHSMPVISFFNATYSAIQRDRRERHYGNYIRKTYTRAWTDCAADYDFSPPSYGYDVPPLPTLFDMDTDMRRDRGSDRFSSTLHLVLTRFSFM